MHTQAPRIVPLERPAGPRMLLSRMPTASAPGLRRRLSRAPFGVRASAETPDRPQQRGPLPGASLLKPGDTVGSGYVITGVLGEGGGATTYGATSPQGTRVAIKALSLKGLKSWKQLDLFEREAKTLKSLDHPNIPRFIDSFEADTETDRGYFLVQEVAEGRSLSDMISGGWRPTEDEVSDIALQVLGVLDYLASLRPPVVHRDVKPENLILGGGRPGGKVFLVDFGGVQDVAGGDVLLGSTVVGTYGYMAPEQFRGSATAQSDLYGLGGTLLFLLSGGRTPASFPQRRLRIDFRGEVTVSAKFASVLEGLLEPAPEDRLSAAEAKNILLGRGGAAPRQDRRDEAREERREARPQGAVGSRSGFQARRITAAINDPYGLVPQPQPPFGAPPGFPGVRLVNIGERIRPRGLLERPPGTRVKVSYSEDGSELSIRIPAKGFTGQTAFLGAFAGAWNAFLVTWLFGALTAGAGLFALLFSLPFWAASGSMITALVNQFVKTELTIGDYFYRLDKKVAGMKSDGSPDWKDENTKKLEGRTDDLREAYVEIKGEANGEPLAALILETEDGAGRPAEFGEGLSIEECEWLASEVNDFLGQMRGGRGGRGGR